MSELLTPDEIIALTGAKQENKQKEVLDRAGIFYVEKSSGGISLTWGHVNNPSRYSHKHFEESPNFAAVG